MARIGFIGLGNMGLPMSLNLRKAEHSVAGFDMNAAAIAKLVDAGGTSADGIRSAVENADAVITMLPSGREVRDVYLNGGMFEAVKRAASVGKDLRTAYRDAYALLKPKYGEWVIFDHCLPFDVSRAYDEATRYRDPRVWTAQRDKELWEALEG